jgi:dGTPase
MCTDQSSPRTFFEAAHRAFLAPYAVSEDQSLGRPHDEPHHPYRTCFQRDRDRIVHCSAFRRLDFKTQVFVPHEHDHFRTRLTHTLEVAQIGRTLGRALRLNEDLIEAVALAHDLGHPPFGHTGEAVLEILLSGHGHFEHNRQSLRVVDYLEHPYAGFRGLNLSNVVRECIAKHKTRYDTPICDDFDMTQQPPLEGQIVELADEIAFSCADLQDALEAGFIDTTQLAQLELWQAAWQSARHTAPDAQEIHQRILACKVVMATLCDDLIATTLTNIGSTGVSPASSTGILPVSSMGAPPMISSVSSSSSSSSAAAVVPSAFSLQPSAYPSPDAIRRAGRRLAAISPTLARNLQKLQDFLLHNVYMHPRTADKQQQARQVIEDLFRAYIADSKLLPPRYQTRIDRDGLHRTACDYIAGMTDRFAIQEHAKLVR